MEETKLLSLVLKITLASSFYLSVSVLWAESNDRAGNDAFNKIMKAAKADQQSANTRTIKVFRQAEALMKTRAFKSQIKVMQNSVHNAKYKHNKGYALMAVQAETMQHMDIAAILKKAYALQRQDLKEKPRLYVFISYSMPESSIRNLYRDANKVGAPLLVRGLINNNFRDTGRKLVKIIGTKDRRKKRTSILVNPVFFKKFGIQRVPAFVFIRGDMSTLTCRTRKTCVDKAPEYDVIYGDITLKKAVETLALDNHHAALSKYEAALAGRQ